MSRNPALFIPFAVFLLLFTIFYAAGKKKYAAFIAPLDKKEYRLREFFPVGFAVMDALKLRYDTTFDRILRGQTAELYSPDYAEFYLRVTYAQAIAGVFIGLLLGTLLFGAMDGDFVYLGLGVILAGTLAWTSFNGVKSKVEDRHQIVALELPELTHQILILSGAGLTLKGAMKKIAKEMPLDGPLYQALGQCMEKMDMGMPDEQAMDGLVAACNTSEVRRFVSVILQNMHRGGIEVFSALDEIGKELWLARKAAAQRIAEKATTKLLFPMILMLGAVMLLVTAPAVMSMRF